MEALNALGINGKLLLAQIINFVILLLLLSKFLYKPIVTMLDGRTKKIEKSLDDAKKIEEELLKTEERTAKALAEASDEAKKMIDQAKNSAADEARRIVVAAEKRSDDLKAKSILEIKEEKEKAMTEIRSEVASLIALATEKVVGKKLDDKEDNRLIKEIIGQLR
jgi:F-type H+-transporting ATPase subunit b